MSSMSHDPRPNSPAETPRVEPPITADPAAAIPNDFRTQSLGTGNFREAVQTPPPLVFSQAAVKERYPVLQDVSGVVSGIFGGDAEISRLKPGQAEAIVALCKELKMTPPSIEGDGRSVNFYNDTTTRDTIDCKIGVVATTDIARDPDYRGGDSKFAEFWRNTGRRMGLIPSHATKTYEEVVAEMKEVPSGKLHTYLIDWYHELRANTRGTFNVVGTAHKLLIMHINRLTDMGLLHGDELERWLPTLKNCAARRLY